MLASARSARAALQRAVQRCTSERRRLSAEALSSGLAERLPPTLGTTFQRDGYAVVDGVLPEAAVDALRGELLRLHANGLMVPNNTVFVAPDKSRVNLQKAGIWELEAHALSPAAAALAPLLSALGADRTLLTLLNVYLATSAADALHSQVLKMQVNTGGGACFPLHHDSDGALDSRRLTALFYLNPRWQPGDGGELVLYPSLTRSITLPPLAGRLVLFPAAHMLHRVLPARGAEPRCMFTMWLFARHAPGAGASGGGISDAADAADADAELLRPLLATALGKHAARAVRADEWAASLEEAHPPSAARDAFLRRHWEEVGAIEAAVEAARPGGAAAVRRLRERGRAERIG